MERVRANLDLATSVYIDRVNHCPCGETVISLYPSERQANVSSSLHVSHWSQLLDELRKDHPDLYSYFQTIWDVAQRHEISGLPSQYFLVCLLTVHTLCAKQARKRFLWYGFQVGHEWT